MTSPLVKWLLLFTACLLLSSCSEQPRKTAQGYIEGKYAYMATSVSGTVTELHVAKGDQVKKGQTLFVLEPQPESDLYLAADESLKQAFASRDAIAADLAFAKLTYDRYKVLLPKKAIQQSQLDNAKFIYEGFTAKLAQANALIAHESASLAQAKWKLAQKTVLAPMDSLVFETYYQAGEYTETPKPILSLLPPGQIKAIFYVSELDLGSIHLQDKVEVECDGCAQAVVGKITFISPTAEYTPPVIFSTETNEKLIFRIEARFNPQEAIKLHPGQPVTVMYFPHVK